MHEEALRGLLAGFDSEPLYTGLYNPQRPPTPKEFTLDTKIEVDSLRLDVLLSQSLPQPQHDVSPRRSAAAGTGSNEPGVAHPVMQQTEQERTFPFQADADGVLHVDCMRIPEWEGTSYFQVDIGVTTKQLLLR